MDIDLLFTETGESGLLCDESFVKKAVGVVIEPQTGILTLEYNDMDYLEFNIPVDPEFFPRLERLQQLHIGAIKDSNIAQAYQIPLMFGDDPYRGEAYGRVQQTRNPLVAFEYFVKACVAGQPVYREDLDDDSKMGCILGDATPGSLEFAPHLARRHAMEVSPKAAPSGPGPSGPGPGLGGGGSSGGGGYRQTRENPYNDDD